MVNLERDFLRKLERAKTEDEKTWLTTKRLIDSLPEDLQTLVFSAAIPHWFDAKLLRTLHPELGRRINSLYSKLQKLPFVEPYEGRGYNIHELTRRLILEYLWKKQRHLYRFKSQSLVKFYDSSIKVAQKKITQKIKELENEKDKRRLKRKLQHWVNENPEIINAINPETNNEYIYHLIIAYPKKGVSVFRSTGWNLHDKFDYSFTELSALIDAITEHISANRVKGQVVGWERFFKGMLYFYQYDNKNAAACFSEIIRANYPEKKLNADVRYRFGNLYKRLRKLHKARSNYEEAMPLYQAINEKLGEANCTRSLGDIHLRLSKLSKARSNYEKALSLYRALNEKLGEANCITSLGDLHLSLSELTEARACYEEAIPLYKSLNSKLGKANCIKSLGDVHVKLSELTEARACYEEAIPLFNSINNKIGKASCIKSLGDVHVKLSDLTAAQANYNEALTIYHDINYKSDEAICYGSLGYVYLRLNKVDQAIESYEKAAEIDHKNPIRWSKLGDAYRDSDLWQEAIKAYNNAIKINNKLAYIWVELGNVFRDHELIEKAIEAYEEALNIDSKMSDARSELGHLYLRTQNYEAALYNFQKAVDLDLKDPYYRNHLGYAHFKLNNVEEALAAFEKAIELDPQKGEFHYSRIKALRALGRNEEAEAEVELTRSLIDMSSEYDRACFELICGNIEAALSLLKEAITKRPRRRIWARHDPDFEILREDVRFKELVGE